ncbi:class I SAM-dependent methyltransferase [Gordonia humi]|uniref:SAM-dependent methyltransferase n=1 Tax=Gordonia humi TaxID=686429 RepID=A0A840FEC5_9ACTN|nr:class I SAM-dependent methyltransferase [Gordonia humi]MBB4137797.1 SAM-dependent methyltransferase [Gordonia humi]
MKGDADVTGWSAIDYADVNANQVRSAIDAVDVALADRAARGIPFEGDPATADIGCGAGEVAADLAARGFSVYATDFSPSMVDQTRRRCRDHPDTVSVDRADASSLRLAPGGFDIVHCSWVMHWLPDVGPVLDMMADALRPGGYVVLQWNAGHPADEPEGQFGILREVADRPRWREPLRQAPFTMRRHPSADVVARLADAGLDIVSRIDDMVIPPPPDTPPMTLVDVRERVKRTGMGLQSDALGDDLDEFLDEAIAVMVEREATSLRDSRVIARRPDSEEHP